jgi:triosephosphate isomerase
MVILLFEIVRHATIFHMKKTIPLIVGNWKCNPMKISEAEQLAAATSKLYKKSETPYVAIAPTNLHISVVAKKIAKSPIMLAAQNVSPYTVGAHTGEQSVSQLKDSGVVMVIVGHSERRAAGETDRDVLAKTQVVLTAKLIPIICIGEQKRDSSGNFFKEIESQIKSFARELTPTQLKKVVIAYEPIWAIGTGETATAEDVKEMQLFIEKILTKLHDRATARAVRLLYGGSVKPHNAAELHTVGQMGGFLVGGASLKAGDFIAITKAVI